MACKSNDIKNLSILINSLCVVLFFEKKKKAPSVTAVVKAKYIFWLKCEGSYEYLYQLRICPEK